MEYAHPTEQGEVSTAQSGESLETLSELGAFYPLISYPAPAGEDREEPEGGETDPLMTAALVLH
jgi:hypothetical protein